MNVDRRIVATILLSVLLLGLAVALAVLAVTPDFHPSPTPVPTPTVVVMRQDSGFHWVMLDNGTTYLINKRYDGLTDSEKDAANRFAHKYPDGTPY